MDTQNNSRQVDISFCLPIYNVEKWVEDCINSIVGQELSNLNYEIVCVDDCSTDNSLEVIHRLAEKHPQIVVVSSKQNQGVSATRNIAINKSRGEFIWFVDPDDLLYPGSARFLYDSIAASDQNVIIANYMRINEDATIEQFEKSKSDHTVSLVSSKGNIGAKDIQRQNNGYGMCSVCCCIFRRSFLIDNDLNFRENIHFQEDTVFYYEFTRKTEYVLSSDCLCYLYRQRSSSAIHTKNDMRMKKYYNSLVNMLEVYEEYKMNGNNETELLNKIHQSKEKIVQVLVMISDADFVKEQMGVLRKKGIYPYPLRWDVLKADVALIRRVVLFLLPIGPFFGITNYIFRIKSNKSS